MESTGLDRENTPSQTLTGISAKVSALGLAQILSLVLIPIMLVSIWMHVQVLDNDRYTDSMRDLGADASFRSEFGQEASRLLIDEVSKLANSSSAAAIAGYLDELGGIEGLNTQITQGIDSLVQSPAFVKYWVQANQLLHQQVVDFVRGVSSVLISDDRYGIALDLAIVASWIDPYTDDAATAVLSMAMSDGATQVQIAQSRQSPLVEWVAKNSLAVAIGSTALFVLIQALAIVFSDDRRKASAMAAIGIAVVAGLTLVVSKKFVTDHLASIRSEQSRDLAREYVGALLRPLVMWSGALAGAGLIIGAIVIALPYLWQRRESDQLSTAMPQA